MSEKVDRYNGNGNEKIFRTNSSNGSDKKRLVLRLLVHRSKYRNSILLGSHEQK